jgi:hypothetical protein
VCILVCLTFAYNKWLFKVKWMLGGINCNTVKTVTMDQNSLQCRALVLAFILGFCCRGDMSCWHIQNVDRVYGRDAMPDKFSFEKWDKSAVLGGYYD